MIALPLEGSTLSSTSQFAQIAFGHSVEIKLERIDPDSVFWAASENDAATTGPVERDVRFIQLFHRGWDQHNSLEPHLRAQCKDTDQASAALVTDLKERGLLEDTLVIWGGEFGRTAYSQGKLGSGRDHHGRCFSMWMAGGGVRGGASFGETDDFCYNIASDPVHIRDLNATMLHCLGIDHERFTYRFQGLDQRLTGVEHAHVVKDILL